ncbi:hypothetical protein LEP1GSC151_0824 [Leptospira interrogans serovar Grippotyphosa str. LT2186]|uniref:Uncharacterized protein n=1 Tax=Leptospira interrogans serovar Grippotyphosa str. LT2186 TaxID=1001599 RepID=M3I0C4_LEPIR|nr:hypothetical protein LEP1GSC151_0824 [Leptospira interrogans serovar Grippotyphosa str. LT2186]EMN83254.1 hypothetical protein LEP1GSC107_1363 [Leptospira interrogans serovar Grippotyphosa str. UI 12769]
MDRRSGLKKAHFFKCSDKNESFYLQKVCFSDKENFSTSSPPKNRKNSTQRSMNRVVGRELSFTEDFVVIPTIDLEIQLFVGLVMASTDPALSREHFK